MKLLNHATKILSVILLALGLAACSDTDGPPEDLLGTAANGAATDGELFVVDAGGVETQEDLPINGVFKVDVRKRTAPFMLKTVASNGVDPDLYSYAEEANTLVNITPLTNVALFIANGNADPAELYDNWSSTFVNLSSAIVADAQATVNANLTTQYRAFSLDPFTYNFVGTGFAANGTSVDGMLDVMQVDISADVIDISVTGLGTLVFDSAIDTTDYDIGGVNEATAGTYAVNLEVSIDGTLSGAATLAISLPASDLPAAGNTQLVEDMFVSFYGIVGEIVINSVTVTGNTDETVAELGATITTADDVLNYVATYTYTLN